MCADGYPNLPAAYPARAGSISIRRGRHFPRRWLTPRPFSTSLGMDAGLRAARSEEHTSELQSLMRISYAVFCLKKKNNTDPVDYITLTIHIHLYILRHTFTEKRHI